MSNTPTDNAWPKKEVQLFAHGTPVMVEVDTISEALYILRPLLSEETHRERVMAVEAAEQTIKAAIQAHIDTVCREAVMDAYENGYNDNARDCYCDGGTIPHKHLLDDGESHDIRPDTAQLNPNKDTE